ncbi:MAG: response regulator [Myxococcales bacterium]
MHLRRRKPGAQDGQALSPQVRGVIATGVQIRLAIAAITMSLVLILSVMTVFSIDRVFNWLTPIAEQDLRWKAERGLVELRRGAEVGLLLRDQGLLRAAVHSYALDPDVEAIAVEDRAGIQVYRHAKRPFSSDALFAGSSNIVHSEPGRLRSWSPIAIEGRTIGRLGLAISTNRVSAGATLRSRVIWSALGVGMLAALLSFVTVRSYVAPLLNVTRKAFVDLEQRTSEALAADRAKSRFLANVSHELRTPLNGVLGMTRLLLQGELSSGQRRRGEIILQASENLLVLINDLLDATVAEAGHLRLSPAPCELRRRVQERAELLATGARSNALDIACNIADEVPSVVVMDGERFEQVLNNVLGNAIKFTTRGDVEVSLRLVDPAVPGPQPRLHVEVSDMGPGIAEADQPKLFRAFSQLDTSASRRHEGTGLGLAISRHLLECMGGEIGLRSEPGKGACFWFALPCEVLTPAPPPLHGPHRLRVLVADESAMYRRLVGAWCSNWGMDVQIVEAATDILPLLHSSRAGGNPVSVLIIDARMVRAQGPALLQSLATSLAQSLHVICLASPLDDVPKLPDALSARVLMKPVRPEALFALVTGQATERVGPPPRSPSAAPKGGRVLVVDDHDVSREVAAEVVRGLGYTCDTAESGKQALEAVARLTYDMVLMDCQMPEMTGYEATRAIRRLPQSETASIPILALTAHALPEEETRVRKAGMNGLLTKPLSPERLEDALKRHVTPPPATREVPSPRPRRSARVLELFLRPVPDQLQRLHVAIERGALSDAAQEAHRLKGGSANVGAMEFSALAATLEDACNRGSADDADAFAQHLDRAFPALKAQIEQEIADRA